MLEVRAFGFTVRPKLLQSREAQALRFLQRQVENRLARGLIAGEIREGTEVRFTVKDDQLVIA